MSVIAYPNANILRVPCSSCQRPGAPRPRVAGIAAVCPGCAFARAVSALAATPLESPAALAARALDRELAVIRGLGCDQVADHLAATLGKKSRATSGSSTRVELASAAARSWAGSDPGPLLVAAGRLISGDFGAIGSDTGQAVADDAAALGPAASTLDRSLLAHRSGIGSVFGSYGDLIAWSYGDPETPRRVLIALASEAGFADGLNGAPWPAPPKPTKPEPSIQTAADFHRAQAGVSPA